MIQSFSHSHAPDRKPKYTVKQAAELIGLSTYTVRYYENAGLIPDVDRSWGNARMFSDYTLGWLRLVHCLRTTGLPIEGVRRYIELCREGESTIPERAAIIAEQEKRLRRQLRDLNRQRAILRYKKKYYADLMASRLTDDCNPAATPVPPAEEPHLMPESEIQKSSALSNANLPPAQARD